MVKYESYLKLIFALAKITEAFLTLHVNNFHCNSVFHHVIARKHIDKEAVVRRRCAGCRWKTMGRGRTDARYWECRALGEHSQACDPQASWGWSGYFWMPFHLTSLHDTGPLRSRFCGERKTKETLYSVRGFSLKLMRRNSNILQSPFTQLNITET